MRIELSRGLYPAMRLHAKNAEIYGIALWRHDAVFADHAILLATGDDFSGQQQQGTI